MKISPWQNMSFKHFSKLSASFRLCGCSLETKMQRTYFCKQNRAQSGWRGINYYYTWHEFVFQGNIFLLPDERHQHVPCNPPRNNQVRRNSVYIKNSSKLNCVADFEDCKVFTTTFFSFWLNYFCTCAFFLLHRLCSSFYITDVWNRFPYPPARSFM